MKTSMDVSKMVLISCGEEEYGFPIQYISSIERVQEVTPVPEMPKSVLGVIHLREEVIPIIDFAQVIGRKAPEITEHSRIVILQDNDEKMGMLVEAAKDVIDIPEGAVQHPGSMGGHERLIQGVAKLDEKLIIVINPQTVFLYIAAGEDDGR